VAVRFAAHGPAGDQITLRVPHADDPLCCGCKVDETTGRVADGQTPLWWIERATCPTGDQDDCCCGAASLPEVVGLLAAGQRQHAFTTHVDLLAELTRHLAGLEATLAGGPPANDVCLTCVTDPDGHLLQLEASVYELASSLMWACQQQGYIVDVHPAGGSSDGR